MKYLLTSGCSFTGSDENHWPSFLYDELNKIYPSVEHFNSGKASQGQDLIQKKVMLRAVELLNGSVRGEEITMVVMWSGINRTAWYITNHDIINEITYKWKKEFDSGWGDQFISLDENKNAKKLTAITKSGAKITYNQNGGWYFTQGNTKETCDFIQQFYMMDKDKSIIGLIHKSLENIIMLQNFCKANNIKLIHQFYMDDVFSSFVEHRDDININYLFSQLDMNNVISRGMYEYVLSYNDTNLFKDDGVHPNKEGHKLWCTNILFPFLKNKGVLK